MKNRLLFAGVLAVVLLGGLLLPARTEAGGGFCHVVRAGESLTLIAAHYGVTVQAIVDANNLWNPNLIYVGQCLIIPVTQPGCTVTHVVKSGEYLKSIAAKYGTTWQAIAGLNGLANPNIIYPGQRLLVPVKCTKPKPKPTPTPTPQGPWTAQYWNNRYLSGNPKLTNKPTGISFNWGTKGPGGGIAGTDFSARFVRDRAFDAGKYRFRIVADDGVRFWLDGVLLVDKWQDQAPTQFTVEREVGAGNHHIQIDYYQHSGGAQLTFSIEQLTGQPAWKCDYFNNTSLQGTPVTTQYYQALDFDWTNKAPVTGVTADYFSARCEASVAFAGGRYQFTATVDDGVRLYVDGAIAIDQWHLSPPTTYSVDRDLSAGTHVVKVEYYENNGGAVLKVRWTQR